MDNTLRAILAELYGLSVEVDRLRNRVAELDRNEETRQPEMLGTTSLPESNGMVSRTVGA